MTRNQCDGCARGLPLVDGLHRDGHYAVIVCDAETYPNTNTCLKHKPPQRAVCGACFDALTVRHNDLVREVKEVIGWVNTVLKQTATDVDEGHDVRR